METPTVNPGNASGRVRRVLDWYTRGFLTEEELLHLLESSIHARPLEAAAGAVPPASWKGSQP